MSLTGLPLLVFGIMASLGAFGLTIWAWGRGGWWRPVTRTLGVLLCEALVLGTVGVAVNRSLEIFPSWSALLDQDRPPPPPTTIVADPTTKLDVWLHDRASEGARSGLVFEWKSTEVKAWHLPAPPVIYVPPRYFTATTARFPVVLIIAPAHAGPAQGGWDPHKVNLPLRADADVDRAVVLFLRTDHADPGMFARSLPRVLDEDLRTSARGWAVIGVGPDGGLGFAALSEEPVRFWSAVGVADDLGRLPKDLDKAHRYLDWQATLTIVGPPHGHPSGAPSPTPTASPSGSGKSPVRVVTRVQDRVPEALHWVYGRLPAPLTAPVTTAVDPNKPR